MLDENEVTNDNQAIIRVWKAGAKGLADKGHVSLQTNKHYISIYPHPEADIGNIFTSAYRGHKVNFATLEDDINIKGREPEKIIRFYTLNTNSIDEHFSEFKEKSPKFSLIPGGGENCSSLVTFLLEDSGIKDKVSYIEYIQARVAPMPMTVQYLCEKAKDHELKQFPKTKLLDLDNQKMYTDKDNGPQNNNIRSRM